MASCALVLAGAVSGVVSLAYLWSGVVLHRRCRRQDRDFRESLRSLMEDTGPEIGRSRRFLINRLDEVEMPDGRTSGTRGNCAARND